jgi:uncharacterized protein DUF541
MRGVGGNRLAWGILGVVALVAAIAVGLTLAVTARAAPAASPSAGAMTVRAGGSVAAGPAGPAIGAVSPGSDPNAASAAWCCSAVSPPGLTATGQAVVPGASAARSSAIARAAADAVSQAKAAAHGAGISLGRIINVAVSVPGYAYPLPIGAAARASLPAGTPAAPDGSGPVSPGGPVPACPAGSPCPYPRARNYVTVTITWAIR